MIRWAAILGVARLSLFVLAAAGANVSAQSSPSPFTSAIRYDAAGRVVGTIAPDPDGPGGNAYAAIRNTYDAPGRLVRVEMGQLTTWQSEGVAPINWSAFAVFRQVDTTYDALDRKLTEASSSGGTVYTLTQYSYDIVGRLECIAVRMNPAAFASLPASACALGAEGSQGPDRITRNVYDAAGQLLKVQRAVGTPIQQDYATYTYTLNGKQASVTDANGNKATLTYDGFDRQTGWYFPDKVTAGQSSTTDYESYGYDANGNRTSLRKRDGRTLTFGYDALNRVTSKIVPDGCAPIQSGACAPAAATRDVYYEYDLRGLQTSARFDGPGGGEGVLNSYDGFGRLTTSVTTLGGIARQMGQGYDPNGNLVLTQYPDGHSVSYYRDGLDRLYYAAMDATSLLFTPNYDAVGRVIALYRLRASPFQWDFPTRYGYDAIGRLTSLSHSLNGSGAVTSSFGYNPASQIIRQTRDSDAYAFGGYVNVNRSYATNGLNQYTTAGPASFSYDANGNLTSDGSVAYGYDAENRLVSGSNGTTLTYDPLGRLWQVSGTAGVTQFLYDGDQLSAEYNGAGTMLRRHVHGLGDDDPQVSYEGADVASPRYLYADHQGSIVALGDGTGATLAINSYDEYGIPGAGNTGRFQYTGQAWLPELGMYYYKARIYSPTLGRFLQTDPIGYDDQINLYAYVANDPVNGRDPSGKQTVQDQQLQMQIDDMRQQGMSEKQIMAEIGRQASIEATALSIVVPLEGLAVKGLGLLGRVLGIGERVAVNVKTGLTVSETKAVTGFFGKGTDGAKAVIEAAGKPGFSLPKGVTEGTLTKYREVAVRAIEAGKPPQVQELRIKAIDAALERLRK